MPQVDLETLVSACAGGSYNRKITCETIAGAGDPEATAEAEEDQDQGHHSDRLEVPPDFPPESFWLSKDAEFNWFDRNAFYKGKESTKASYNSGNLNPSSNSNSQRFSLNRKSKASIIGLLKPQKSCFVDAKNRKAAAKPANTRLFPKRNGSSGGKSNPPLIEPSSPKVSCMGRVQSKKDRNRRLRNRNRRLRNRNRSVEPAVAKAKPDGKKRTHRPVRQLPLYVPQGRQVEGQELRAQARRCSRWSRPHGGAQPGASPATSGSARGMILEPVVEKGGQ